MSDTIPPPPHTPEYEPVDLRSIRDLLLEVRADVMHELEQQKKQWGEAELILLERGNLHKKRLDGNDDLIKELQAAQEELRAQFEHFSDEISTRLDELARKTEPAPPLDVDG